MLDASFGVKTRLGSQCTRAQTFQSPCHLHDAIYLPAPPSSPLSSCTLYWGSGWLAGEAPYLRVRHALSAANFQYSVSDICSESDFRTMISAIPPTDPALVLLGSHTDWFAKDCSDYFRRQKYSELAVQAGYPKGIALLQVNDNEMRGGVYLSGMNQWGNQQCPAFGTDPTPRKTQLEAILLYVKGNPQLIEVNVDHPGGFGERASLQTKSKEVTKR